MIRPLEEGSLRIARNGLYTTWYVRPPIWLCSSSSPVASSYPSSAFPSSSGSDSSPSSSWGRAPRSMSSSPRGRLRELFWNLFLSMTSRAASSRSAPPNGCTSPSVICGPVSTSLAGFCAAGGSGGSSYSSGALTGRSNVPSLGCLTITQAATLLPQPPRSLKWIFRQVLDGSHSKTWKLSPFTAAPMTFASDEGLFRMAMRL
mmetsp:Transcript_392/g.931  ORF Transcript_392/g.931 Transcript_392/m.931 type:complete len:203 (-) Transcript_392:312-920(-)